MNDASLIQSRSAADKTDPISFLDRAGPRLGLGWTVLINAAVGGVFACYFFTKSFLAGTASYFIWPQGDMEMFLTGTRYFVHDAWRFPLFVNSFIERSYTQSMVFTDCVPLFALITKIIYTITGHEITDLAWWYVLVIVAQPVSFSLLLWFGGVRNSLLLFTGGIFALLVPAFLYRVGHTALFGHFTFVTAMALYFASADAIRGRRAWPKWLLIVWPVWLLLCSTINLYLLAMAGTFFGAALAHAALSDFSNDRIDLIGARALYGVCVIGAVGALMFVFGFFVPYLLVGDIGVHSSNLISPFVPQISALFANSLAILDATGGQYEGYNYYGAGFLGLILFAFAFGDGRSWRLSARHPVFICALIVLTLFAVSNVGYAGKLLLWSVPAPKFLGIFRSSGRFVWPLTYFSLFLTFYALDAWRASWRLFVVVAACLFLQWQDMRILSGGIWNRGHETERPVQSNDSGALRELIAQHNGVYIAPDFACAKTKLVNDTIMDIGWYTALDLKPINTIYFARAPIDISCDIKEAEIDRKLQQNYLAIVFYDPGQPSNPLSGFSCAGLEGATVCLASNQTHMTDDLVHQLFTPR